MNEVALNLEIIAVLVILTLTVVLFIFEVVRVDVVALGILVLLGLTALVPGLESLSNPATLFSGFSSNAVISIIAVMIIGAGLDRTGVMHTVAAFILRVGGRTEKRITATVSASVGLLSGIMQNVGAAALFVPVVSRVATSAQIPVSRVLMPMGFAAILGGTVTLVGSSPLIMLNDLLPAGLEPFDLFDATPVGLALLVTGIAFFALVGRFFLPNTITHGEKPESVASYFSRVYKLDYVIRELITEENCPLISKRVDHIERSCNVRIIATQRRAKLRISPNPDRVLKSEMTLAVMGTDEAIKDFANKAGLVIRKKLRTFKSVLSKDMAGISELVIPADSSLIGKTPSEISLRRSYDLSVLAIHRGAETFQQGLRDIPLQAGDTLVSYSRWSALPTLEKDPDVVVVTSGYPKQNLRIHKIMPALTFFAIAMGLVLFSKLQLSLSLLVGAVGMIITGVISMDEAYRAISWKTIFLLAGLLPLGVAVQDSGTAAWIAHQTLNLIGDVPGWALQTAIAVLATAFSLVMSNVGATVLLVPLAISIAISTGNDPRIFALTVALATSNAFLIPTHQVNALIMGPGGYRVKDFLGAGGVMTVLFLVVMLTVLNFLY